MEAGLCWRGLGNRDASCGIGEVASACVSGNTARSGLDRGEHLLLLLTALQAASSAV